MFRFLRAAGAFTVTLSSAAMLAAPASAGNAEVSLARLAPELGYTFTWIAAESAVALTRPGLYVLVRPGNPLYDVNDSVELSVQAPQYRNNDIYVGSAFIARLRGLAIAYPQATPRAAPVRQTREAGNAPASGALTVTAVPTHVSDGVIVSGTGPANVPLVITLSADITQEIPRVTLSKTKIVTDATGNFSVEIPTAPLHLERSLILISATSLPGVSEAHTSFVLGSPSPNIKQPVDELPRDFRPH